MKLGLIPVLISMLHPDGILASVQEDGGRARLNVIRGQMSISQILWVADILNEITVLYDSAVSAILMNCVKQQSPGSMQLIIEARRTRSVNHTTGNKKRDEIGAMIQRIIDGKVRSQKALHQILVQIDQAAPSSGARDILCDPKYRTAEEMADAIMALRPVILGPPST